MLRLLASRLRNQSVMMLRAASSGQSDGSYRWSKFTAVTLLVSGGLLLSKSDVAESEGQDKSQFQIPRLLEEREIQKKEEYLKRSKVDVEKIMDGEMTRQEAEDLREADEAYLFQNQAEEENAEDEENESIARIIDPYVRKRAIQQNHQEYRTIIVGPEDLIKNGQMVQIAVSDPFNKEKFHPTDKIILCKHQDKNYCLGAFCGFDYTNLATGALLGERLFCPTCGSAYDIKNGYVDNGPTLRAISSFVVNVREEKLQVVVPEHIPAFARKKMLQKQKIDPRTFVVLGDSETALAAIDALRSSFTGNIVCVPQSPFGAFENLDVLRRKFTPLTKNEVHLLEDDFMDKANITVMQGEIKKIDVEKKQLILKNVHQPIEFDKILIAWGSEKARLEQEFSNVYYLEDRQAHSRCHNELLKAKVVVVLGGTLEAYQTAASIRDYLDSLGYSKTQILLMYQGASEVDRNFGKLVSKQIHGLMRNKRISVMMDCKITKFKGINKLEAIHFKKSQELDYEKILVGQDEPEYFIKPDVVIAENGLGDAKIDINKLIEQKEGGNLSRIGVDVQTKLPASNIRFSLIYNDIMSPIYAAGSCTMFPSFMHKIKVRTDDVKYNIECGFYAAMNMLDKRCEFRYLPMYNLTIGEKKIYFVGERNTPYSEIIVSGDVNSGKYVVFYVYGDEICSFVTVGYQNLHLYLHMAMKKLLMPTAAQMRAHNGDFKSIVAGVLRIAPNIEAGRQHVLNTPSVIRAEFTRELEVLDELRKKINSNIRGENAKQQAKLKSMKEKYDREGVQFVDDEQEIGRPTNKPDLRGPSPLTFQKNWQKENVNMGKEANPFSQALGLANSFFGGKKEQ